MKFIESGFSYLSKRWPEWKKKKIGCISRNNNLLKPDIEGNKVVAKIFCKGCWKGQVE